MVRLFLFKTIFSLFFQGSNPWVCLTSLPVEGQGSVGKPNSRVFIEHTGNTCFSNYSWRLMLGTNFGLLKLDGEHQDVEHFPLHHTERGQPKIIRDNLKKNILLNRLWLQQVRGYFILEFSFSQIWCGGHRNLLPQSGDHKVASGASAACGQTQISWTIFPKSPILCPSSARKLSEKKYI